MTLAIVFRRPAFREFQAAPYGMRLSAPDWVATSSQR
jgi:hypothetical protein